jgi:hypothetical protein
MRLVERLRLIRETRQAYQTALDAGQNHEDAADTVADAMQAKYGASLDWSKIIEIIMMILAMFKK